MASDNVFSRIYRSWYAGGRPNWIARALNDLWRTLASAGLFGDYMVTLEVVGRRSGRRITFPVVVAVVDGERYLVSMLGEQARWVANVRAADGRAAIHRRGRHPVVLREVPVEQRAPVIREYVRRAPGGRQHIPVAVDAPLEDFAAIAADFPTFRIDARP